MPRRPRVLVEGGLYHVYNRFARGAELFREGDEGERFVDLLRRACERNGPGFAVGYAVAAYRRSVAPVEAWVLSGGGRTRGFRREY